MAHYSARWLGAAGAFPDTAEYSVTAKGIRKRTANLINAIIRYSAQPPSRGFNDAEQELRVKMQMWLVSLDIRPPKTRATVISFEYIVPDIGRLFIYCYKGKIGE